MGAGQYAGGDIETSLMLALRPDTVGMAAAQDFASSAESAAIAPVGAVSMGWISADLNPVGVVGNAAAANAEKGHATALYQVRGMIDLLQKMQAQPQPQAATGWDA